MAFVPDDPSAGRFVPDDGSALGEIPGSMPGTGNRPGPRPQNTRGIRDRIRGADEAAMTLISGGISGLVAPIVGLANSSRTDRMAGDRAAGAFMDRFTYAPRTDAGQEYAGGLGQVAQGMMPLAGLSGQMARLSRNSKPAMQFVQDLDRASSVKTYTPAQISAAKLNDPAARGILRARELGLVVPPTDAQAGIVARTAESLSGEPKLQKLASQKNASGVNNLIRQDLGLGDDVPLTRSSIAEVRKTAGEAYEPIKSAGAVSVDEAYFADIGKASSNYTTAAKSFAHRSENPFAKVRDGLLGDRGPDGQLVPRRAFDAASAIEEVKLLRADADRAYMAGDKQLGSVYRDFANALDNAIDRNLKATGTPELAGAVDAYRAARKLIAKTYLADEALNSATGNIKAATYARALDKRVPLDGPARDVANFAKQFPRASQHVERIGNASGPTVFDAMGAMMGKEALLLGARPGIRGFLASGPGQGLMKKPTLSSQMLKETPTPEMTTSFGFDPPPGVRVAAPLGDLTPEWTTSAGFEPRQVGIDGSALYRAVLDDPSVSSRTKGRPQMPAVSGLPGLADTIVSGRGTTPEIGVGMKSWNDATVSVGPEQSRLAAAPMAPGGIELSRIINMPKSGHRTKLLNDFKRRYPNAAAYIDEQAKQERGGLLGQPQEGNRGGLLGQ